MDSSLLAIKLRIPPLAQPTIDRPRLIDALERAIRDDASKLILLSAPAGYGKTTLLAQWARTTDARVAWLSLGEEENDPERFFRSLVTAWEAVQPGIIASPLGTLLGGIAPEREAVLRAFVNVASTIPDPTVFVLDDVHLIGDPAVHEPLTFLLEHLPPTLHVVLAGRSDPPLPLARYRAHNELVELRGEDLQFREDESAEFLNRGLALELGDDAVRALHAQLEGWIAGLQLVSLTLRRHHEVADALPVSGRHRFIADYLSEDVLSHLPDDVQRFLLQTSILDRLCGSLCDAVTGAATGQEMLEFVERENLFLVPLDDRREWFRYHRLFADFLRDALRRRHPEEVATLHGRAAVWYLEHDLPDPAFRHAIAGDDPELAMQILEQYESEKLHGGEFRVLQAWLDAIPAAWHAAYPQIGLVRAGVLVFAGDLDACVRCIDDVERRLAAIDDQLRQQAKVTAFRCFVACFQSDLEQAERHAAEALRDLREEDVFYRADIYHALGDTYRGHGRWEDARAHYLKVLEFTQGPGVSLRAAHVYGALADLDLRQGRLRDAERHWRKALAAVKEPANWGRLPLPVIGWVYLRLGELLYERHHLAEARELLIQGLASAELGGDVRALIAGQVLASRIELTEGDLAAAAGHLERAGPLVEQASFPEWTSRYERGQIELWLAQDRLRAAVAWADAAQRDDALAERADVASAHLALARVLIVKGDGPSRDQALALLGGLLRAAAEEGRAGIQIEALALRALGLWQAGDRAGAMVALEHALRLAEPEGYVRLFADLGFPMIRLLQEARARNVFPDFVSMLLTACGAEPGSPREMPEPLSQRELDVLNLMASGLTNREIADALFISPETVKKHTGSIYAKLGVGHRTGAVARARDLSLLDGPS
jgi:LuxR family maltose regulon positive regulatory protein